MENGERLCGEDMKAVNAQAWNQRSPSPDQEARLRFYAAWFAENDIGDPYLAALAPPSQEG